MTQYSFVVRGTYPPKKSDTSPFRHKSQLPLTVPLRHAAAAAIGDQPTLTRSIKLTLVVHGPPGHGRITGDLDNQVSGLLDALQASADGDERWRSEPAWCGPDVCGVLPDRAIGIADDGAVVEIVARRVDDSAEPWYEVTLEGDP